MTQAFPTITNTSQIMNSIDPEECVPLYLRHNDPMCVPILSHNAPTNNVLLKITVPKRTGRKRKRGSQDPYEFDNASETATNPVASDPPQHTIGSVSRMDEPSQILRKLKDNMNNYKVEAVGEIRQSHRYRGKSFLLATRAMLISTGMSDFHQSTSNTEFIPKFKDTVLTGRSKPHIPCSHSIQLTYHSRGYTKIQAGRAKRLETKRGYRAPTNNVKSRVAVQLGLAPSCPSHPRARRRRESNLDQSL